MRLLPLLLRGLRVSEKRCHIEAATLLRGEREAAAPRCDEPRRSLESGGEPATGEAAVAADEVLPAAAASDASGKATPRVELR